MHKAINLLFQFTTAAIKLSQNNLLSCKFSGKTFEVTKTNVCSTIHTTYKYCIHTGIPAKINITLRVAGHNTF